VSLGGPPASATLDGSGMGDRYEAREADAASLA